MTDSATSVGRAWVVTGPTSGIGYRTALELASHGVVVLIGRNSSKLDEVRARITSRGGRAHAVVADLSDVVSARRAATETAALDLPIGGLLNNAGVMTPRPGTTEQGWDSTFATNHLGPLALTDALIPDLPDGATVVFVCSSAEDPENAMATRSGFRGSRYLSAEASARGEYQPGGSAMPGADAYATSKEGNLAAVFSLAREAPRLRFRAVEPGFNPGSNLSRNLSAQLRLVTRALTLVAPVVPAMNTPRRAARTIARVLTDPSDATGTYVDGSGRPMRASSRVSDPSYSDRYVAESRALLSTVPDRR